MQARMQAAMQNMPPERRAMFEAKMKELQQKTHDYALTNAGHSEHVGSYSCEIWNLARDGKQISEYCVAAKGSLPGGDELIAASHKAATVALDVLSAAPQMAKAMPPIYALYGKMDGFPVLTRHLFNGKTEGEDLVTAIERQSLPANKFEIPKGFTETPPVNAGDGG